MLVLITYDICTKTGQGRLRNIAQICLNHGMRVQNSVFECDVNPAQWEMLKKKLLDAYEPNKDSLRFYFLGSRGRQKVEHHGAKKDVNALHDALIL